MYSLRRNLAPEVLLGLGLAFGHATSLRFAGLIGFGEVLILFTVGLLCKQVGTAIFRFSKDWHGVIKVYFFLVFLLISPVVTVIFYVFSEHRNIQPEYLPSFGLGFFLSFLIVEALKKGSFQSEVVAKVFFVAFVFLILISYSFFPRYYAGDRFIGFASDPNQLMFYISSLLLLMSYHFARSIFLWLPVLIYIGLLTGSDSFSLQVILALFLVCAFTIFFRNGFGFSVNILSCSISVLMVLTFVWVHLGEEILSSMKALWRVADNGGYRIDLIINGFKAISYSPILGNGTGSFSGTLGPFEGSEAHSTFIDLASQFGVIVPLIIYITFLCFIVKNLMWKQVLIAGFAVAFIVSGLFHNNGRHFIFWYEFGLIYYFVFFKRISDARKYCNNFA